MFLAAAEDGFQRKSTSVRNGSQFGALLSQKIHPLPRGLYASTENYRHHTAAVKGIALELFVFRAESPLPPPPSSFSLLNSISNASPGSPQEKSPICWGHRGALYSLEKRNIVVPGPCNLEKEIPRCKEISFSAFTPGETSKCFPNNKHG